MTRRRIVGLDRIIALARLGVRQNLGIKPIRLFLKLHAFLLANVGRHVGSATQLRQCNGNRAPRLLRTSRLLDLIAPGSSGFHEHQTKIADIVILLSPQRLCGLGRGNLLGLFNLGQPPVLPDQFQTPKGHDKRHGQDTQRNHQIPQPIPPPHGPDKRFDVLITALRDTARRPADDPIP